MIQVKIPIIPLMTSTVGVKPTIPATFDHTDGSWTPTDIYIGQTYFNVADEIMYTRSINGIVQLNNPTAKEYKFIGANTYYNTTPVYLNGITSSSIELNSGSAYTFTSKALMYTASGSVSAYNLEAIFVYTDAITTLVTSSLSYGNEDLYSISYATSGSFINFAVANKSGLGGTTNVIIKTSIMNVNLPI